MRELRDALEQAQQETVSLRAKVATLTAEIELQKAQLQQARSENERLAQLMLKGLNPTGQKSAFSLAEVAELVAFLKR